MNKPQGPWALVIPLLFTIAISLGMATSQSAGKRSWDFESDEPGAIAKGFTGEVGQWEVFKEGANKVFYQKAKSDDATFNVALAEGTSYKDVDLSVRLRAVAGQLDRGGGVVWRAKDKKNYYICRYNPLEDNFRVYKVVDGVRNHVQERQHAGRREVALRSRDDGRVQDHLLLRRPEAPRGRGCDIRRCRRDRPLVQGRRAVVFR